MNAAAEITERAMARGAAQKPPELEQMVMLLLERAPAIVMEIGTMDGGTLSAWCDCATDDALIVSVDLPGGPWGGGYNSHRRAAIEGFAKPGQRLVLIEGDSRAPETRERVLWELDDRELDFLFIDGDHSYQGVGSDFAIYGALVRHGGLAALHDVLPHPQEQTVEVDRFWAELKERFDLVHEFCVDGHERTWGPWGGIGVVEFA